MSGLPLLLSPSYGVTPSIPLSPNSNICSVSYWSGNLMQGILWHIWLWKCHPSLISVFDLVSCAPGAKGEETPEIFHNVPNCLSLFLKGVPVLSGPILLQLTSRWMMSASHKVVPLSHHDPRTNFCSPILIFTSMKLGALYLTPL
jgi:hypothetical protein